ncbi:hypothetical protein, partial [Halomonas ventosae]
DAHSQDFDASTQGLLALVRGHFASGGDPSGGDPSGGDPSGGDPSGGGEPAPKGGRKGKAKG